MEFLGLHLLQQRNLEVLAAVPAATRENSVAGTVASHTFTTSRTQEARYLLGACTGGVVAFAFHEPQDEFIHADAEVGGDGLPYLFYSYLHAFLPITIPFFRYHNLIK